MVAAVRVHKVGGPEVLTYEEIDVAAPGGVAHEPEFVQWRWEKMANLPDLVVPFKHSTYERVVR